MLSIIGEALGLANVATNLLSSAAAAAKGVVDLVRKPEPDLMEIKRLAAQLVDEVLAAKARQMELEETLLQLQGEAKKREKFAAEAPRYALTKTDLGGMVYALRPEEARGEPDHDLCAACFEAEIKSVLQPGDRHNTLACGRCGGSVLKSSGRSGVMIGPVSRGIWEG